MADNVLSYGFYDYQALANQRINTIQGVTVYDMVTASAAMHTEQVAKLLRSMCLTTTNAKWKFKLPKATDLQPATGNDKPDLVRGTTSYDVALPIQGGKTGYGFDQIAEAYATLQEVNAETVAALQGDGRWLKRHILSALFTNTDWTFTDERLGSLTIRPLANATSGEDFPLVSGGTEASQHYMAQAASIADATNPFDNIHAQLKKHPSNMVDTNNPVVVYVASNLSTSIQGLANFVPVVDPDLRAGISADSLAVDAGRIEQIRGFGDQVLGKCDNCWIVEWGMLPDSYMIAHATGAGPILGMREHEPAQLRGFFAKSNTANPVLSETWFYRFAGFGVINRVAGLVYRIGDASYAIPTGYTAPLNA